MNLCRNDSYFIFTFITNSHFFRSFLSLILFMEFIDISIELPAPEDEPRPYV